LRPDLAEVRAQLAEFERESKNYKRGLDDCRADLAGCAKRGLAMAKRVKANGLPTIADVVKAQAWDTAPCVTDWGSGMLVADVALSKDVSLTMFIHKDALAGLGQREAT